MGVYNQALSGGLLVEDHHEQTRSPEPGVTKSHILVCVHGRKIYMFLLTLS